MKRYCPIMILLSVVFFSCSCGRQQPGDSRKTVGLKGVVYPGIAIEKSETPPCERELSRKETAERMDRLDMLYSARVAVDCDISMLTAPDTIAGKISGDFFIAETPPEIEFAIIPVEPKFLQVYNDQDNTGWWGNYCQSNYDPPTKTFYTGVADHGAYDAHMYLVEYDSQAKQIRCLPEVNVSIGRKSDQFGDGIIHGWLDFYQSGDLPRPHLWFMTYWAKFPEPDAADYATGYRGGHILSYDMEAEEFVDYGVPLPGSSWPYHRVDAKRGMLYGVSYYSEFLAWDINEQKTIWAGYLPDGMKWYNRTIMLDEADGAVYTVNSAESDPELHIIRYDPGRNRFALLDCRMPENEATGTIDPMRAQERHRGPDGLIYGITSTGELFAFDPANETVTDKGIDWPGEQRYVCSMERSPGGRYIYYQVQTYREGAPVIQYDTVTGKRKVLAFLREFYYGKYGYIPTGSYSIKLDDSGGKLFIVMNGAFMDYSDDIGTERWGHCSAMVLNIPESERIE